MQQEQVLKLLHLRLVGYDPTAHNKLTEEYNGSTWTDAASLNTARLKQGSGIQTCGLLVVDIYQ
jgi:hypothetical protein